jgi:hypothetical protein
LRRHGFIFWFLSPPPPRYVLKESSAYLIDYSSYPAEIEAAEMAKFLPPLLFLMFLSFGYSQNIFLKIKLMFDSAASGGAANRRIPDISDNKMNTNEPPRGKRANEFAAQTRLLPFFIWRCQIEPP